MKKRYGFTLIELLVVIAIIALLLSVVMPGLNMAKKKAASAVCLSNTRQMSVAWYMYQDENDSKIMSSEMEDVGNDTSCDEAWICRPFRSTDTTNSTSNILAGPSDPVTDEDEIRGVAKGKLFPYMKSPDVYHCPADKLRKGPDGTRLYVSYAVPTCLNGFSSSSNMITKFTNITSPGTRYNFVEIGERERSNWTMSGHFIMATPEYGFSEYGLWSPLAISHGNSAVFGFADGHAEVRKWHDQIVFEHYERTEGQAAGTPYNQTYAPAGGSEDLDWLVKGWAFR